MRNQCVSSRFLTTTTGELQDDGSIILSHNIFLIFFVDDSLYGEIVRAISLLDRQCARLQSNFVLRAIDQTGDILKQ